MATSAPMDNNSFFTEYGEANRFSIHEVIGKGSYGVVCSATDNKTGEKVAIKKITDVFLVESILEPSKEIREGYETIVVITDDGLTVTGLLAEETDEKIVISTPGIFNLSKQEEEIPWRKVAGFDYRSGIFWDQVTVETRGQSASQMPCLAKSDGKRIRQVLQTLES